MSAWVRCAVLSGTKTLDGRCIVRSIDNLPFLLQEGMEVHFVPPVLDAPRAATVEEICFGQGQDYYVRFSGIESKNDALPLVSCYLLVDKALVDTRLFEVSQESLEGFCVFDIQGNELGVSLGLESVSIQTLLHIKKTNGKDVLIPYVDEFIHTLDLDSQCITISAPAALLDLEY